MICGACTSVPYYNIFNRFNAETSTGSHTHPYTIVPSPQSINRRALAAPSSISRQCDPGSTSAHSTAQHAHCMPRCMFSAPHPRPILRRNTNDRVPAACAGTPPQATTRSCTTHNSPTQSWHGGHSQHTPPQRSVPPWTRHHPAITHAPHTGAPRHLMCACTPQVRTRPRTSHLATTTTTLTNCEVFSIALQPTTERLHPSLNSKQPTCEAKRQARRRGCSGPRMS